MAALIMPMEESQLSNDVSRSWPREFHFYAQMTHSHGRFPSSLGDGQQVHVCTSAGGYILHIRSNGRGSSVGTVEARHPGTRTNAGHGHRPCTPIGSASIAFKHSARMLHGGSYCAHVPPPYLRRWYHVVERAPLAYLRGCATRRKIDHCRCLGLRLFRVVDGTSSIGDDAIRVLPTAVGAGCIGLPFGHCSRVDQCSRPNRSSLGGSASSKSGRPMQ